MGIDAFVMMSASTLIAVFVMVMLMLVIMSVVMTASATVAMFVMMMLMLFVAMLLYMLHPQPHSSSCWCSNNIRNSFFITL